VDPGRQSGFGKTLPKIPPLKLALSGVGCGSALEIQIQKNLKKET
jgi:hypothetical protein